MKTIPRNITYVNQYVPIWDPHKLTRGIQIAGITEAFPPTTRAQHASEPRTLQSAPTHTASLESASRQPSGLVQAGLRVRTCNVLDRCFFVTAKFRLYVYVSSHALPMDFRFLLPAPNKYIYQFRRSQMLTCHYLWSLSP